MQESRRGRAVGLFFGKTLTLRASDTDVHWRWNGRKRRRWERNGGSASLLPRGEIEALNELLNSHAEDWDQDWRSRFGSEPPRAGLGLFDDLLPRRGAPVGRASQTPDHVTERRVIVARLIREPQTLTDDEIVRRGQVRTSQAVVPQLLTLGEIAKRLHVSERVVQRDAQVLRSPSR